MRTSLRSALHLPKARPGVSRWRRFRARFDWPLALWVALIAGLGLLNLYSATHGTQHAAKFDQQIRWMVLGVAIFAIVTFIDYRTLVRAGWPIMGFTIAAIVVIYLLGDSAEAKGAHRWINIGPVRMQPSEMAKIAVMLALARLLQEGDLASYAPRELAWRLFVLFLPVVLVAKQPDLGSASLVLLIILSIACLALQRVWPVIAASAAGLAAIPLLWERMHTYQKQRVLAFLDPAADPTGSGWHTRQSVFAVGSGRITGKGYMEGTQNQFDFLPEHWTDFPFSVWAEEWGFLGSVALLVLFGVLIFWILYVALNARERAGAIICIGVAAMVFWHVTVNISMVLGWAPVVGVTLPFVSYGGSSLVTFFAALGLVSSVSLRRNGY